MTPSEVLAELHESIQRKKRLNQGLERLNRRLRLLEAARIAQVADQLRRAMEYDYVSVDGRTISQDTRLDFKSIADAITLLLRDNPELDEDEVLRADMIEGQTNAFEFLSHIVRKIGATQAIAAGTTEYIGELQERKA